MSFDKILKVDLSKNDRKLLEEATNVLEKSYSPYSGLKVGASFLLEDNFITSGANIENASYSLCMCAERVGLFHAKMQNPNVVIQKMVITAKHSKNSISTIITPCGACRQVLLEQEQNQNKDIELLLTSEDIDHVIKVDSWKNLVPLYFDKNFLIKE